MDYANDKILQALADDLALLIALKKANQQAASRSGEKSPPRSKVRTAGQSSTGRQPHVRPSGGY